MKVLLFSDHHSHNWKPHSNLTNKGLNSRLEQGLDVLKQIECLVKIKGIDRVLFGGDMFHIRNPINVGIFNPTYDAISRIAEATNWMYMLVGNHDQLNKVGNIYNIHAFSSIPKLTVLDKMEWWHDAFEGPEDIHILSVPYSSDNDFVSSTIETATRLEKDPKAKYILLGHLGINKAIVGSNHVLVDKFLLSIEDLRSDYFDQVFLGHYHKSQSLTPNVHYIGSTMAQDWGDVGDRRGCLIWDTTTNLITREELDSPRFLVDPKETEAKNNFVKLTANFDSTLQQKYYDIGALDVDFDPVIDNINTVEVVAINSDKTALIDTYIDQFNEDLDENLLREIGNEILERLE